MINEVMNFKSQIKRFPPALAFGLLKNAMESVEKCNECEECLEKCPYNLPIPEVLRENLTLYQDFVKKHG